MKYNIEVGDTARNNIIIMEHGNKAGFYFQNILIFSAIGYLVTQFTENPLLICILIFLLFFIFLPLNSVSYFFVTEQNFLIVYKRIFFLQFINRKRMFQFNQIKKITAILKHDKRSDLIAFMINLNTNFTAFSSNTLDIEMLDGTKKLIKTDIYKQRLLPLFDFMKRKGVEIEIIYPSKNDM